MMKQRKAISYSNQGEIPFDLIFEIFLRLPAKSTARFLCVSKLWYSTIRSQNFTESFFTMSSSRPKLLFTCLKDGKTVFFSAPQPQNSSPLTVSSHKSFPVNYSRGNCPPVRGLVCGLIQQIINGRRVTMPMICNPSTGKYLSLPRVKTGRTKVFSYLGYDPIDKKFKVLCMTEVLARGRRYRAEEHQVLTLEVGKKRLSWRMIKCDIPHAPRDVWDDWICINGVVYYFAYVYVAYDIVCFDIKSEKFTCIRKDQGMDHRANSTLVNYKGKLAMLQPNRASNQSSAESIQLWVLRDPENSQWSSSTFFIPPDQAVWPSIINKTPFRFVGMVDTGEIVLSTHILDIFYLVYLNIKSKKITITRVEIRGMEDFKNQDIYAYLDHVEDLTFGKC